MVLSENEHRWQPGFGGTLPMNRHYNMPYRIVKRLINERQKQRPCNCIAWNPVQENLVAAGYEKSSKGQEKSCLLVWDIN